MTQKKTEVECGGRLRIIDWALTVPAAAVCTLCAERFTVPVVAGSAAMALANLQYQFNRHRCRSLPSPVPDFLDRATASFIRRDG